MDKVLSPKSPPSAECVSDAEEKEISDDDDRNHKHKRRDNTSHSLELDSGAEDIFTSLRKRNKPFDNGFSIREGVTQSNDMWRNFNFAPLDKELSAKFDRRRTGFTTIARAFDVNKKFKLNHAFSDDFGSGRGRGCSGNWSQRDARFNSVAIASQMIHQGSVNPRLFTGRGGLPTVSSASATASWGAYGLISGVSSGRMDTLHSLGLQGTIGSSMNPSLSIGIPRQRCRDFEERGFCLRGDMCPMEHGVNRIVIEDVQSLSQFNLPVSLPSVHMLGTTARSGAFPLVSTSSSILSIKGRQNKSAKIEIVDKSNVNPSGNFAGDALPDCADLYDPDQPLWNNDSSEPATAILDLHSSKVCNMEVLSDAELPEYDRHNENTAEAVMNGNNAACGVFQCMDSSMSRRGHVSKHQEPNINKPTKLSVVITPTEVKEGVDQLIGGNNISDQRNHTDVWDIASKSAEVPYRKNNVGHDFTYSSKMATKTLFLCGLPEINEKRSALLSHFKKFGKVIDIYIPIKGGRAFIQFSKREEAEAALMSPDAVMGNRFIKVLWAYRDTVSNEGSICFSDELKPSLNIMSIPLQPHISKSDAINDNIHYGNQKAHVHTFDLSSASLNSRTSNLKAFPPPQKKLINFQLLKELRKKQELLDQKRIEFSQQLHKYEKAKCGKVDVSVELPSPKLKTILNEETKCSDMKYLVPTVVSTTDVTESANNKLDSIFPPQSSIRSSTTGVHGHTNLKKSQFFPAGSSSLPKPIKLDNCPTSFQIIPPLPPSFEDVDALKEHFLSFSDLSFVELNDMEFDDSQKAISTTRRRSALITFATHGSAENAFRNGRCWKGFNLNFKWVNHSDVSYWKSEKERRCVSYNT